MTDRLYDDPDLVQFYDAENGWDESNDFCRNLAAECASILDLGCGTGLLAAALAKDGNDVVGVDRAGAMLDVARSRDGGAQARWIEADARSVRLDRRFELVVLTGHAFQVFLTPGDRAAVLRTIASHLAPTGRFAFDCRNPVAGEWREWTPERSRRVFWHPCHGEVTAWNDVTFDAGTAVATYETHYRIVGGRIFSTRSRIAFPSRDEVSDAIGKAGLRAERWLGDWFGAPWHPTAPEIIPIGRTGDPKSP